MVAPNGFNSNCLHVLLTVAAFVALANLPVVSPTGMNSEEGNTAEPTFQFDPGGNAGRQDFCWVFLGVGALKSLLIFSIDGPDDSPGGPRRRTGSSSARKDGRFFFVFLFSPTSLRSCFRLRLLRLFVV